MFKRSSFAPHTLTRATACVLAFVLSGQGAPAAVVHSPPAAAVQQDKELLIPDGTELSVVTTEEISSKTATEGDVVTFKIEDDLVVDNHIVILKGTIVKGLISAAQKSGRLGKGGKLGIRVEGTTTIDGQKLKLRASQGKEGGDKIGTTIALVALFGVFGFFKKGSDAKIKVGTKVKVYTDEARKVYLRGANL